METKRLYIDLGNRIRTLRKSQKLTQDILAKRSGISRPALANIEAGRQQLFVHHIYQLASALDLDSPSQLLIVEPKKTTQMSPGPFFQIIGANLTDEEIVKAQHFIATKIDAVPKLDSGNTIVVANPCD